LADIRAQYHSRVDFPASSPPLYKKHPLCGLGLAAGRYSALYVRLVSFLKPAEVPNQSPSYGPWPYTEGLTITEANNELRCLPRVFTDIRCQSSMAPLRLVVPWKYGFKSIKSVVKIEFMAEQPRTFWNSNRPDEYGFEANVDPATPHPRWSQQSETDRYWKAAADLAI
jgi:methionine sulfoxide reductase catalytic subunit